MKVSKKELARKVALVALGSLILSGQAYAAEEPEFQLEQVTVTATRTPQKIASVAADVTVITAEQIEQKGARNLADALDGVPGVLVSRRGGTGDVAVPYIYGSDRVVVMVDGKRINIPQGVGRGSSSVNLNNIVVADNIEKIEVVRGGGSALYGADAVGGVINIVTKKGNGETKTAVSTEFGTHNTQVFSLTSQGEEKGTHWFFSALQDKSDGNRVNSDHDTKNAALRLDRDLNARENLTFTYDYFDSKGGNPGSTDGGWLPGRNNYIDNSFSLAYSAKHEGGTSIIKFYDKKQDRDYTVLSALPSRYEYTNKVRAIDYQDSKQANESNYLTWGAEYRQEQVITADYGANNAPKQNNKALYIQNQYKFNSQTNATIGLRYDNNSAFGSNLLPKVSVAHQADTDTTLFASWGKVFKAPKFDDLYTPYDPAWGGGNPNLKPETGWTAEVGAKKKIGDKSEATISLFKRELDDAIDWAEVSPWVWQVENIDHLSAIGVNATYATKLSSAVNADFGYTYLDSHDEKGARKAPYHSFNLGLNIKSGKLNQTVQGRYISEYTVAGRVIIDSVAKYKLNESREVYLKVNNIFDKQYEEVRAYPAPGRTFTLGLKQTF